MLAQFSDQSSSPDLYGFDDDQQHKAVTEKVNNQTVAVSRSPSLARATNIYQQPEEAHYSAITFKTAGYNSNLMYGSGSFLSFDQNDQQTLQNSYPKISSSGHHHDYNSIWDENVIHDFIHPKCSASGNLRHSQDFSCVQSASPYGGGPFVWPNSERNATINGNGQDQLATYREPSLHKRPHMGESAEQALKRQCSTTSATKKPKPKSTSTSKDPQSIAAKNRRERISERLKILQELVPNGSKVDLVTMLEKAISYVKFLQLQVKVLATDEFWPAQGGKAPDLSQVKEALDVILSSPKDRNSSSK